MRAVANSLPKSGTHLLSHLLDLLGVRHTAPVLTGSLVRPTMRNPIRRFLVFRRRAHDDDDDKLSVDLDEPRNLLQGRWLEAALRPLHDRTHLRAHVPYSGELESFLLNRGFKLLFMIRNPRDVLLSYVNHMLRDPRYPFHKEFKAMNSMEQCMQVGLEGITAGRGAPLAGLQKRISRVMGWYRSEHVLTVRFEDLIGPQGSGLMDRQRRAIRQVCDHLELDWSDGQLDKIATNVFSTKAETFHQGRIGAWKEAFTPSIERAFVASCGSYLGELRYE